MTADCIATILAEGVPVDLLISTPQFMSRRPKVCCILCIVSESVIYNSHNLKSVLYGKYNTLGPQDI